MNLLKIVDNGAERVKAVVSNSICPGATGGRVWVRPGRIRGEAGPHQVFHKKNSDKNIPMFSNIFIFYV